MSRQRTDSREANDRLWAFAAQAEAHPLSADDIAEWLLSLSGLNDFEGKIQQLAICEDLLRHADEDDMLDADRTITAAAIARLHKELDAIPEHLRLRRRVEYCRVVATLNLDCGEDFI